MIQERPGAKNRPTPKRRDQEAANKRPLVGNAKAAKADVKTRQRAEREQVRQGMLRGEEKYLPKRDQGGAKRLARDIVDARWNIGEFLLPLMLIVLALMLFAGTNPRMQLLILPLVYGVMAIGVLDAWFLTRRVKKRVTEEFGESAAGGLGWYVALRSLQMRMSRVPRPQIKRGEPVVAHRR
ncbi:DUF3043 domain-containing protein [Ornithinimicrobium ciconiae]|uniref:DUF3043 domain-containing protein n=2 Tax=Ornithinimicrobium ciconiae TaxID=2594265 RepID=A0A516GFK1_9MICO|nr:DUF3043 domain-containing protein [Ornithinimicrobium ciconiae]